jgi:hypothetical protein
MDTSDKLQTKLSGANDLKSVVRTKKALSASIFRQYERAVGTLSDYYHSIALGIVAYFREEKQSTKVIRVLFISVLFGLFIQCNDKKKGSSQLDTQEVKQQKQDTEKAPVLVNYHLLSLKDTINWLNGLAPGGTLNALLVLNRVDFKHLVRLDSMVMPDTIDVDLKLYAPFPNHIDSLLHVRKILLISYNAQAFGAYENGVLVKWGAVSMGKKSTPTPLGLYFTNWKSKETISTVNSDWVMKWYFNIDNFKGVSIHEFDLPGYPASHSCIRLSQHDAKWFYYWANQWILSSNTMISAYGTPVFIYGSFPFEKKKPWLGLSENRLVLRTKESKNAVIPDSFITLILKRQEFRDSIIENQDNQL